MDTTPMKSLSFIHPHVVLKLYDILLWNIKRYFEERWKPNNTGEH